MKTTLDYFKEICAIPHGSYNIDAISEYLVNFAKEHKLSYRQDEMKNVIIKKEASAGYENEPGIILQGHMDMVAVKDDDCELDLEKDSLVLCEEDGLLFAKGTSLGGDDGIAVAMALEVLADDTLSHPFLECIFTVNEEVGMDGATALDMSDIKGKYLINIDSEEEGVVTTSCAGGVRESALLRVERDKEINGNLYSVEIKGLKGGHSGTAIHEGRANACIVLGRLLRETKKIGKVSILDIYGGEKDNAIPNFAKACIEVCADESAFFEKVSEFDELINDEYKGKEDEINIVITPIVNVNGNYKLIGAGSDTIIDILCSVPDGVVSMCEGIDMVETSLNLGLMKMDADGFKLDFCLRSSVAAKKEELKERLGIILAKRGCELALSGDYPGWEYNDKSLLTKIVSKCYEEVCGKKAIVTGVHAGLECGILLSKKSDLDCVSIGPDIYNIHTTHEKLDLKSVERTMAVLRKVISTKIQ